jgi:uncharacterized protein YbaP (TraB family)
MNPPRAATTAIARLIHVALTSLLALLLAGAARAQDAPDCPPVAQPPSPAQRQAGMRQARDHGFLWRISKGGRSSWLYGTLHVAKFEWTFPGPQVSAALRASDTLALELDALDPEVQRRMTRALAAQAHAPLPPALQQRLDRVARAECAPSQALAALAPEMQIATLTTLLGRRDGLDAGYGIDLVLAGWGHAGHLEVVSLESPELQLKTLQSASPAETVEAVESALDELEGGRTLPLLLRMAQVWADGDWAALSGYASWCDCLKTAADRTEMARMLDERNPALADGIAALHASGKRVFAAVGSLHMIGPTGLPALLAQRGYRVERITYDPPRETRP